jgi:RNA polymerase sigma-70 factor (ECF subfamily)
MGLEGRSGTPQDERELVARTLNGDRDAFRFVVLRHQGFVADVVYRATGDRAVVEDLAQETFLRAYQALPRFDPRLRLSTWLARIAVNVARDHGRRSKVRVSGLSRIEPGKDRERGPHDSAVARETHDRVVAALSDLSEPQREVVVLSVYGGLSQREIAGALEVPLGTVKTRHRTALQRLKSLVAPLLGGSGSGDVQNWAPEGSA